MNQLQKSTLAPHCDLELVIFWGAPTLVRCSHCIDKNAFGIPHIKDMCHVVWT